MSGTYKKAADVSSTEIGLCFQMRVPYDDTMDCMTLISGEEALDQVVLIED